MTDFNLFSEDYRVRNEQDYNLYYKDPSCRLHSKCIFDCGCYKASKLPFMQLEAAMVRLEEEHRALYTKMLNEFDKADCEQYRKMSSEFEAFDKKMIDYRNKYNIVTDRNLDAIKQFIDTLETTQEEIHESGDGL